MSELEELRQKRLRELMVAQQQQSAQDKFQERMQEQEVSRQIDHIISQIMTPEARERLGNIRTARPDYARQIEILMIQLHQAGRLPKKVDDAVLKNILGKISSQKRETRIQR